MRRPSTDTINLNFSFCPPTSFFVIGFCYGEVFSYIYVMLKRDFIIYFCIIVVWAFNAHEPFKTLWRWFKIFLFVLIGTLVWDNIKKAFKD